MTTRIYNHLVRFMTGLAFAITFIALGLICGDAFGLWGFVPMIAACTLCLLAALWNIKKHEAHEQRLEDLEHAIIRARYQPKPEPTRPKPINGKKPDILRECEDAYQGPDYEHLSTPIS